MVERRPDRRGDFVYSFRRLLDPASGAQYANLFYVLKNGEAINKGTMKPDALGVEGARRAHAGNRARAPDALSSSACSRIRPRRPSIPPMSRHTARDFVRPGNLVSDGAYVLSEFTPNDRIVLTRNQHFHDAANVRIDREEISAAGGPLGGAAPVSGRRNRQLHRCARRPDPLHPRAFERPVPRSRPALACSISASIPGSRRSTIRACATRFRWSIDREFLAGEDLGRLDAAGLQSRAAGHRQLRARRSTRNSATSRRSTPRTRPKRC